MDQNKWQYLYFMICVRIQQKSHAFPNDHIYIYQLVLKLKLVLKFFQNVFLVSIEIKLELQLL